MRKGDYVLKPSPYPSSSPGWSSSWT